jgi:hypothetical protein
MRSLIICSLLVFLLCCITSVYSASPVQALPFSRALLYNPKQLICGQDVAILQNLLVRSTFVRTNLTFNACFDLATATALQEFQQGHNLPVNHGVFDLSATAPLLVDLHIDDGYSDDGAFPANILYKVHVQVYENRSIETIARISIAQPPATSPSIFYYYIARTHGQNSADDPNFPLNCLTSDGATPTGLGTFDLNAPEDDPKSFGPWPVNRVVYGLAGNMGIYYVNETDGTINPFLSAIRSGILQHTGEWDDWNPSLPMPNSHGCIHCHPQAIFTIWQLLNMTGVVMHKNVGGQWPYPFKTQGMISVEMINHPQKQKVQHHYRQEFLKQESKANKFNIAQQ